MKRLVNSGSFKKGHKSSEAVLLKLREKKIGNKNALGTKHTEEWKEARRQHMILCNPMKLKVNQDKIRILKSGILNNWYIDGRTPENKKIRASVEVQLWRNSVFSRDNWSCQKCTQRGGKLRAHHIRNFAEYPELRTSIENGITLCDRCHLDFHVLYGKKKNNLEQINNFIKK